MIKRRSFASASSDSNFASTPTPTSSQSQSQLHPPPSELSRTLPPSSLTDGATPSLCSDNDVDKEDDRLPSTPPVSVPPAPPFRNVFRFKETGIPVQADPPPLGRAKGKQREVIDVDMLSDDDEPHHPSPANQPLNLSAPPAASSSDSTRPTLHPPLPTVKTPPRPKRHTDAEDLFAKRPPTSPLPLQHSPRKPRPPARRSEPSRPYPPTPHPVRSHSRSRQCAGRWDSGDENEDPLSLRYSSSPEPGRNLSVHALSTASARRRQEQKQQNLDIAEVPLRQRHPSVGSSRSSQKSQHLQSKNLDLASSSSSSSARRKRRLTLDEELRDAHHLGSMYDEHEDDENVVLMGVGERSKKLGFLAHGGAGGIPVFMGAGYVEGAGETRSVHHGGGITDDDIKYEDDNVDEEQAEQLYEGDDDEYRPRTTGARRLATAKRRGRR